MTVTVDQNVELLRRAQQLCSALYAANHNATFEEDFEVRAIAARVVHALAGLVDYMPGYSLGYSDVNPEAVSATILKLGATGTVMQLRKDSAAPYPWVDKPTVVFWGNPNSALANAVIAGMRVQDTCLTNNMQITIPAITLSGVAVGAGPLKATPRVVNNVITSLALVP